MKQLEEQTTEELQALGWNLYSQRDAFELKVRSLNEAILQLRGELARREDIERLKAEEKAKEVERLKTKGKETKPVEKEPAKTAQTANTPPKNDKTPKK